MEKMILCSFIYANLNSIAVAVESFGIDIRKEKGIKFSIWDSSFDTIPHIKELKMIHSLNNLIKHNQGEVQQNNSQSAKYLVEHCGYKDGSYVGYYELDIDNLIYCVYVALLSIAEQLTQIKIPVLKAPKKVILNRFNLLIPDITGLNKSRLTSRSS